MLTKYCHHVILKAIKFGFLFHRFFISSTKLHSICVSSHVQKKKEMQSNNRWTKCSYIIGFNINKTGTDERRRKRKEKQRATTSQDLAINMITFS